MAEQARQNERASQQTQEIAEASNRLIEADANSRRELLKTRHDLDAEITQERLRIDADRHDIESERKRLAYERQQAPIVANAVLLVGGLLASVVPLLLYAYLLRYLTSANDPSSGLSELLIEDIASDHPMLLPPPANRTPLLEDSLSRAG